MKEELFNNNEVISSVLKNRIDNTLLSGNQVMLILDSKGYSNSIMCKKCHRILKCPKCQISLTYYKESDEAKCKYCGRKYVDYKCECGANEFTYRTIGIEMVKEKLEQLYPDKNILLVDSDTMKNNEDYQSIVLKIESQEADIIVGTSNIVALTKYSCVKLIGLLCVDNLLAFSDYRASYNAYNLISKAVSSSHTVIQGYNLSHYCIQNAVRGDYINYFNEEIETRKSLEYPPFININKLIITGEYKEMYHAANYVKKVAGIILNAVCLGPSYDKVKRGVQVIIKHNDYEKLYRVLNETEKKFEKSDVQFSFERNPRYF